MYYIFSSDWETVLYSTSPNLYPLIGFLTCLLVSLVVSLLIRLCHTPKPVEQLLLHPLIRYKDTKGRLSMYNRQRHIQSILGKNVRDMTTHSTFNDAWHMGYDHPDTHYRWPSPSLPPTLKSQAQIAASLRQNVETPPLTTTICPPR